MTRTALIAVAAVAALTCARPSFAQRASISGVVTKFQSGEPAAGATVKLVDEPPSTAAMPRC
jgi:hypothetical protein